MVGERRVHRQTQVGRISEAGKLPEVENNRPCVAGGFVPNADMLALAKIIGYTRADEFARI